LGTAKSRRPSRLCREISSGVAIALGNLCVTGAGTAGRGRRGRGGEVRGIGEWGVPTDLPGPWPVVVAEPGRHGWGGEGVEDESRVGRDSRVGSGSAGIGRMSRVREGAVLQLRKGWRLQLSVSASQMRNMCGCGGEFVCTPRRRVGRGILTQRRLLCGSCMVGLRALSQSSR
jgi:hypothetical protein